MKTNRNSIWEFHNLSKIILTCETLTKLTCYYYHIYKTCYFYFIIIIILVFIALFDRPVFSCCFYSNPCRRYSEGHMQNFLFKSSPEGPRIFLHLHFENSKKMIIKYVLIWFRLMNKRTRGWDTVAKFQNKSHVCQEKNDITSFL